MSANTHTFDEQWPVDVSRRLLSRQLMVKGTRIFTKDSGGAYKFSLGEFANQDSVHAAIVDNGGVVLSLKDASMADMILDMVPCRRYGRKTYLPVLVLKSLQANKLVDITKYRVNTASKRGGKDLSKIRAGNRTSMYETRTQPLMEAPVDVKRRLSDIPGEYPSDAMDPEDRITDILLSSQAQSLEQLHERAVASPGSQAGRTDQQMLTGHDKGKRNSGSQRLEGLGEKTRLKSPATPPKAQRVADTYRRRTATPTVSQSSLLSSPKAAPGVSQKGGVALTSAKSVGERSGSRQKPSLPRRKSAVDIISQVVTRSANQDARADFEMAAAQDDYESPELGLPTIDEPLDENNEIVRSEDSSGQALPAENQEDKVKPESSQAAKSDAVDLGELVSSDGEYPDPQSFLRDRKAQAVGDGHGKAPNSPGLAELAEEHESGAASPEPISTAPQRAKLLGKRRRKRRSAPEGYGQAALRVVVNEDSGAESAGSPKSDRTRDKQGDVTRTTPQRRRSELMRNYTPYSASKRIRVSSSDSPLMASLGVGVQSNEASKNVDQEYPALTTDQQSGDSIEEIMNGSGSSKVVEDPVADLMSDADTSPIAASSDIEEDENHEKDEADHEQMLQPERETKQFVNEPPTAVRRSSRLKQKSEQLASSSQHQEPAQPAKSRQRSKRGQSLPVSNKARRSRPTWGRPKSSALPRSEVLNESEPVGNTDSALDSPMSNTEQLQSPEMVGVFSPATLAANIAEAIAAENWRPAAEMFDELDEEETTAEEPANEQRQQQEQVETGASTGVPRLPRPHHRRVSSHHQLSFCEQVLRSLDHSAPTSSRRLNESLPQSPATPQRPVPLHLRSAVSPPSSPALATVIGGTMRVFGDNEVEMTMADKELMCRHVKGLIFGTECSPRDALRKLFMCSGNWGLARSWILAGTKQPAGAWTSEEDSVLLQGTDVESLRRLRERRGPESVYRRLQFFNEFYS
ncbi:hypothetical protein FBU59_000061 [Linderina macrospora]|uniref:Uncharacterized protein n=1 Tax=Linderina macrospora TaxID=4868 RepID=A0ACC1JI48_9FUNG|nr:hypothetical protein FBU59_000061 [Linderina macrospora]